MDILNDPLPDDIIQGAREAKGNIVTKNASYRRAVCTYIYSTENLNFCVERGVLTPFQWECQ